MMLKTPVLVETRVPRSAASSALQEEELLLADTFSRDLDYRSIWIEPTSGSLAMSLEAAKERLTLIRGTIQPHRLNELRSQPTVVDAFLDTEISPFNDSLELPDCDDWLVDVGLDPPGDCPIPPCDHSPSRARGCLLDVSAYLGVDRLWQEGINGNGVVIGIVDGGILAEGRMASDRPGLVPRVIGGWPITNWGTIAGWRRHGNMVAIDALGVAPRALLYDIRISDGSQGGARMSDAVAGIEWAIEKYRSTGTPQILCCGWGIYQQAHDPIYAVDANHPLTRKVLEAIDEGMLVLFAAGNGGQSCPATWCGDDTGPGKCIWGVNGHPRVMTVGAVNKDEELVSYSSQGPAALDEFKPDFCGISHFSGYFCSDSGTSAACAVASGVVALLKQARPNLTQEAAKRLLKSTAKDIGPPGWDRHSGSGIIQAEPAYHSLVGLPATRGFDAAQLRKLEAENRFLRELFIDLALAKRICSETPQSSTSDSLIHVRKMR